MPNRKSGYRDLDKFRLTVRKQKERYKKQFERTAVNLGKRYTEAERNMIMKHEITDREIALMIGRTPMGIQRMRSKWRKHDEA